ncbi:phage tail protein [Paenibacillus sp. UASWS1643]|uniref:phage tail protein n=1 Tax=Paenibacillus sp. UASWS1643 TaxID=2580422 RepID=UPI001238756E|nr:phage tail protein [Paenibacillus sp. UASWS1643]KAA8750101.1 hypothetical protein FE296_16010 [Paenibacillus sp. UASWS1643]
MRIRIKSNARRVRNFGSKVETSVPKSAASAMNRATQMARTAASRKVREKYTVKAASITKTFSAGKASAGSLRSKLVSSDGSMPLIRFKTYPSKPTPKKLPKVLKASILNGGKKVVPGAFVTKVGSHIGVLERKTKKRLPIKELLGPAVPVMVNKQEVREETEKVLKEAFETRMMHELGRNLGRINL